MISKKAQGQVSGLVILIGVLIVLYVLLLPPCDKCILLNNSCPDYCEEEVKSNNLLSVYPGEGYSGDKIIHNFDSMNLFINYDPKVRDLAKNLEISKGWFGSLDQEFNFKLENLADLDSSYLSFLVMEANGDLYIYLNDKQVFSGKASPGELITVELPISYLAEDNTLNLYVGPPGILFWVKNNYLLRDFKLNEEFIKIHSSEERYLVVSYDEKNYLKDSVLEYSIYCTELVDNLANFKVYLNDVQLSSEFISCISDYKSIGVNKDYFIDGTNTFMFLVDDGSFLINDIKLKNSLEKEIFPSYNFDVISKNSKDFIMLISFNSLDLKSLKIEINGEIVDIETNDSSYEQDITNFIKVGKNNIRLVASNFDIDKLEVWYE